MWICPESLESQFKFKLFNVKDKRSTSDMCGKFRHSFLKRTVFDGKDDHNSTLEILFLTVRFDQFPEVDN